MMGYLYASFGGAFVAWAMTRFAVAKGWYLAHKTQIASTVQEAKALGQMAAGAAKAVDQMAQSAQKKA